MDFNEILNSLRRSTGRAWERVASLTRTNRILAFSLFLILGVGVIVWAASGFSFEIGRFFASEGSPTPIPTVGTLSNVKSSPWLYCDYATKTGLSAPATLNPVAATAVGTSDYNAAGVTAGGVCIPGTCRTWQGGSPTSWVPSVLPANVPACEPLSVINSTTIPGYSGAEIVQPPVTFPTTASDPNCFVIQDRSSQDPNFGTSAGNTVPTVLRDRPNAKLFMKAFVVNNCPWEVHYVLQVDLSKKAQTENGAGKRSFGDTPESGLVKLNMPEGFDFPSCWNSGLPATPANCAREISIEFDLKKFTCGSAGITTAIWHRTTAGAAGGAAASGERGGSLQYSSHLNWGRDCTGAPGERAPAAPAGSSTACPAPPQPPAVKAAVLSVTCSATNSVLLWQKPLALNAAVNSVIRTAKPASGPPTTSFIFTEGGCWNSFGFEKWTDAPILPNVTYEYSIKTHPSVISNVVACRNGVQVSASGSPFPTPSTGATTTFSPTPIAVVPTPTFIFPTPTVFFTPTPTDDPTNGDDDNDGVSDFIECSGVVGILCPDSDNDGIFDNFDLDSDDDGIPDSRDCNRLVAGTCSSGSVATVPTGPGEATLLAVIVSAVVSLLYASYTHSPLYRRREADELSDDQAPLDFRR